MNPFKFVIAVGLIAVAAWGQTTHSLAQAPSRELARKLLAKPARPKRPDLPPSRLPLDFVKGERIALVGNSTAERMNLFGHFETLLHTRFPDKELVVRNFARPAD